MIIHAKSLKRVVNAILKSVGSRDDVEEVVAEHLVVSNLAGHDRHGFDLLQIHLRILQAD